MVPAMAGAPGASVAARLGGDMSLLYGQHHRHDGQQHHFHRPAVVQVRCFFFGNSDDKGGDDKGGDGKGGDGKGGGGGGDPTMATVIETNADSDGQEATDADGIARVGTGDDAPRPSPLVSIPLLRRPLFPGMVQGLLLTDPATITTVSEMEGKYIGLFLRKEALLDDSVPAEVVNDVDELHSTGTLAQIHNLAPTGENSMQIFLTVHRRVDRTGLVHAGPPLNLKVHHWPHPDPVPTDDEDMIRAYSNEIVAVIRDLVKLNPLFREHAQYFTSRIDMSNPYKLADFAASLTTAEGPELQDILEEANAKERLSKALLLISKEREMSRIQQEIQQNVEEKISKQQREYFLNEQLRSIKKELGMEVDDKEALLTKFRDRVKATGDSMPEEAAKTIEDELQKLGSLEKNSAEFNTTRNYLDWLTQMPWGVTTEETFDLTKAQDILNADHAGLDEVMYGWCEGGTRAVYGRYKGGIRAM